MARKFSPLGLLALSFVAGHASLLLADDPKPETPSVQKAEEVAVTETLRFWSYVPDPAKVEDTRNADGKWPLILFLHGAGERGADLNLVKIHGPPKVVETKPLPFVVVSPQCPSGSGTPNTWRSSSTKS